MKKALLVLVLVLLYSCNTKVDKDSLAPDFALKSIDGDTVELAGQKGKLVLLHFWADYCSECRAEFPRMQKAYAKLRASNFEVLAVNAGQSRLHVEDFKEEYGITFPMLVDEVASVAKKYQVRALPTNFIISPDGRILDILVGWASEEYLQRIVAQEITRKQGPSKP